MEWIFGYLILGLAVSTIIQMVDDREWPFEKRSLGFMLIWPLFVFKWLVLAIDWLAMNIKGAVIEAVKRLFK